MCIRDREIIDSISAEFESVFSEKGLAFTVTVEENLPMIKGDRYRISQVMSQILSNAAAFTDQGSVTCSARKINNEIVVSIADTGRGIDASRPGVIFEKFSQLGDTLTDKPKGVGLGLPICRLIVKYHGGKISVESEPGKGSVFTIVLPVEEEVVV